MQLSDEDRRLRDRLLRDSGFKDLEDSNDPDGLLRTHACRAVNDRDVPIEAAELHMETTSAWYDVAITVSRRTRVRATGLGHAAWRLMCEGMSVREAARKLGISRQKVERETEPFRKKMASVNGGKGLDPSRQDIKDMVADAWLSRNLKA